MSSRQSVLAVFGGACLGLIVGLVLGGFLGSYFVRVEDWEAKELYGFIGFFRKIRGIGIGAGVGGLIGAAGGAWLGAPKSTREKLE